MYMLYFVIFLKRLHIACLYTDTIRTLQGYNCEYVSFVVILLYLRVVLGIPG